MSADSPSPAPPGIARLLATIGRAEQAAAVLAFAVLVAVVFADVASREFTGRGLHWALQAGVYANYVVFLLGFGLASAAEAHLRPRFADRWLPARWDRWLGRCQDAGMAAFCAAFAVVGVLVTHETWLLGDRSAVLGNPLWPLQALLPLAFGLAAFRHACAAAWPSLRRSAVARGPGAPDA